MIKPKWNRIEPGYYQLLTGRRNIEEGTYEVVNLQGMSVRFSGNIGPSWEVRWVPGTAQRKAGEKMVSLTRHYTMAAAKAAAAEFYIKGQA